MLSLDCNIVLEVIKWIILVNKLRVYISATTKNLKIYLISTYLRFLYTLFTVICEVSHQTLDT